MSFFNQDFQIDIHQFDIKFKLVEKYFKMDVLLLFTIKEYELINKEKFFVNINSFPPIITTNEHINDLVLSEVKKFEVKRI